MAIYFCKNPKCTHEFQDKKYGQGMRVKNRLQGKNNNPNQTVADYRCVVCGQVENHIKRVDV